MFRSAANYVFTINLKTMALQPEINFQRDIASAGNELLTLVVSDSTTWKSQRFCLPVNIISENLQCSTHSPHTQKTETVLNTT